MTQADPTRHDPELRTVFELAPIGVFVIRIDDPWRFVAVNPAACRMLGTTEADLLATRPGSFVHPDDQATARVAFRAFLDGIADRYRVEQRVFRRDGTMFWARVEAVGIPSADGTIDHFVSFMSDIDAERRLGEHFRGAAQATAGAFAILESVRDGAGRIVDFVVAFANERGATILGATDADLNGRRASEILPAYAPRNLLLQWAEVVNTSVPLESEWSVDTPRGTEWWEQQVVPAGDGVAVTVRDVTDRRAAQELLLASERRLDSLVRHGFDLLVISDPDGTTRFASPSLARTVGIQPDDLVGTRPADLLHPDDYASFAAAWVAVLEDPAKTVNFQARLRRPESDAWRVYDFALTNLVDDPAVGGIVANARDVTDEHAALEALREREQRFAALVQHGYELLAVLDADGRPRWLSPSHATVLGRAVEDPGLDDVARIHPDDIAALVAAFEQTLAEPGQRTPVEYRVAHGATNEWRLLDASFTNLLDDPAVGGIVLNARDVTEERTAVAALRESEERFRSLVQNSFDLLALFDATGRATYVSPSHETLLGHPVEQYLDRARTDLVHPEDLPRVLEAVGTVAKTKAASVQYRYRHADGSYRHFEAVVTNRLDEPAVQRIVVNARDVTDKMAAIDALRSSEERFRSLVQHSSDLVAVWTSDGFASYLSPSHEAILGYSTDELVDSPQVHLVHPDDVPHALEAVDDVVGRPDGRVTFRCRLRHADGTWRTFDATFTNLLDDPAVRGLVSNCRDITEAVDAEDALRESEERFRALVRHSSDVVAVLHRDGTARYVSPAAEHVLGYSEGEFASTGVAEVVHPDERGAWRAHFDDVLAHPGREHVVELRLRHADGRWLWIEARATNLLADPALEGVLVHLRDVSERRVAEAELAHQALHDPLSGLPNRALVLDRIGRSLARGARTGLRTVVLFIDVDRFKVVNDSLGHAYGDDLLVAIAARLRGDLREVDTVARLGGDEFVVLLEDVAHENVGLEVAEKLLSSMRRPFRLAGREFFVTASIGLAVSGVGADTADSMVRDADAAMYVAKGRGRNRLEVFDEAIRVRVVRHLETEHDLHRALERHELRVVYQPIYELSTRRITGVEALVRWDHPRRGLLLPGEFIGVAEETGLVVPIGEWIVDQVCRQAAVWKGSDPTGTFRTAWVNVSARQLAAPGLAEQVRCALAAHSVEPGTLGIELTESTLIEEAETARDELRAIEEMGVGIAIDDFGTGYSSLLYLRRFHVDVVKLDRSFVSGVGTNSDDTAIAGAVVSLAHALGMQVSAEGVETELQLETLASLGCDTACGYLLVRPTTPDILTELLRDQR